MLIFLVKKFDYVLSVMMSEFQNDYTLLYHQFYDNSGSHWGNRAVDSSIFIVYNFFVRKLLQVVIKYVSCVCKEFYKYRRSFKLIKYNFLQERYEYVELDITLRVNSLVASEFKKINHKHSLVESSLDSFIRKIFLVATYNLIEFHRILQRFHRQLISLTT